MARGKTIHNKVNIEVVFSALFSIRKLQITMQNCREKKNNQEYTLLILPWSLNFSSAVQRTVFKYQKCVSPYHSWLSSKEDITFHYFLSFKDLRRIGFLIQTLLENLHCPYFLKKSLLVLITEIGTNILTFATIFKTVPAEYKMVKHYVL